MECGAYGADKMTSIIIPDIECKFRFFCILYITAEKEAKIEKMVSNDQT